MSSTERRREIRNQRRHPPRVCSFCRCVFRPKEKDRITFCSRECAYKLRAEKKIERQVDLQAERLQRQAAKALPKPPLMRPCMECGKQFIPPRGAQARVPLCSEDCRSWHYKAIRKSARARARAAGRLFTKIRKRARHYGVEYEPFPSMEIYQRDRWKCGLCGERILFRHSVPHPLSPTIDHIIPMSKGGPHTRANVQAAHFICNSRKGTKSKGEQLRLVG